MKPKLLKHLCLFLLLAFQQGRSVAQPDRSILESRPDLFTFFTPGNPGNPFNADMISKGVMQLDAGLSGTAFPIRTFRDDDKVCVCLTGHQVTAYNHDNRVVIRGKTIDLNTDVYMNLLGKDSLANGVHYTSFTGFSKSFIKSATVLEHFDYDLAGKDAALILVDKKDLPAEEFAMLGYSFENDYWDRPEYWYSIAHPHRYPQRIADSMTYMSDYNPDMVFFSTRKPYVLAEGGSGAPLMIRLNNTATPVKGIFSRIGGIPPYLLTFYAHIRDRYYSEKFYASTRITCTKIGVLEQAIRNHCWKKADSAAIAASSSYRETVLTDNKNNTNSYKQNSIVSAVATLMALAQYTEAINAVQHTTLHANVCDIGGFTLPTTYPGGSQPWAVAIAAKQINVGNDFNYTADGNSELQLATVVINAASSTARKTDDVTSTETNVNNRSNDRFKVYPNPSPEGIFHIALPAAGSFSAAIHSLDGKSVYRTNCTGNPFTLRLGNLARGSYVLNIYDALQNKIVFTTMIVY